MYQISIRRRALKDLESIPPEIVRLISQHIDKLQEEPRPPDSKKLKGDSGYSQRVGVYRILYDIDDSTHSITIYRIKHRRDAYR